MGEPFAVPPSRRVFCNRTLNLRSIGAIGYDMDYTLVHYRVDTWERHAYDHLRRLLAADGWPVGDLEFEPEAVARGLIVDSELGNIVKANRFGYVMRAAHGTRLLDHETQRELYRHLPVNLAEPRFFFLNTLFSLSESCLFAQLVDLYDDRRLSGVVGYEDLFRRVRATLDHAHLEGTLKAEIIADPERFVDVDPDAPAALVDQKQAGKRLMLISNSEWAYAREIMAFAYDPLLPRGVTWRDLFELVIVGARKPDFFSVALPLLRIVDDERGLLAPEPQGFPGPGLYQGGDADAVERYLDLSGSEILYVGDHIWADVHASKRTLRWRTALILRELEGELEAIAGFRDSERELVRLMVEKETLEREVATLRLTLQRRAHGEEPRVDAPTPRLRSRLDELHRRLTALDERIAPLARRASELHNERWGLLLRSGNDKSHLARQVERSADVYTSRVGNLLHITPFAYLRATRGSMPHDPPIAVDGGETSDVSLPSADDPGGAEG